MCWTWWPRPTVNAMSNKVNMSIVIACGVIVLILLFLAMKLG